MADGAGGGPPPGGSDPAAPGGDSRAASDGSSRTASDGGSRATSDGHARAASDRDARATTRSRGQGPTLVTGGTGFTGGALCRRLVADGEEVVAFVRASSDTRRLEALGVDCRTVDITDAVEVAGAVEAFDTVYHIAATFRVEHADPTIFTRVNVDATRNLLEAACDAGVRRFVHCSTVGVQGDIDDPPADEEYRFAPGDQYQQSKLEGELVARGFMGREIEVSVVRPAGIYGPGDTRFLKLFRSIARRRFVMIGDGEVLYHLTYIDDLVDGIVRAGRRPEAVGEVFTLAGARYTTLDELVEAIARAVGAPPPRLRVPYAPVYAASVACERLCRWLGVNAPLYPRRVEFFEKDRAFDISKARRLLGYEPAVDLDEGLARTAAWYREQGLLDGLPDAAHREPGAEPAGAGGRPEGAPGHATGAAGGEGGDDDPIPGRRDDESPVRGGSDG